MIVVIEIIESFILMAVGYFGVCVYLEKEREQKTGKRFAMTVNKGLYLMGGVTACTAIIIVFHRIYHISSLSQLKLLTLVLMIFPIAAIDYKIKKIPNVFIIAAILGRIIFYIFEFLDNNDEALNILKDNMIGAFVVGGFFFILSVVFKNSIGMGDIKLFWVMGLYQGIWGVVNSVFFSLCVSFVAAVFLLISKKKNKKDTIAFGPCILLGTVIAVISAGM